VYVTSPDRINVAGQLDVICFDKTGTLTEQGLELMGIVPMLNGAFTAMQRSLASMPESISELLATCHGLARMGEQLVGDPLDQKLFAATGWQLHDDQQAAHDEADEDVHINTWVCPAGQPGKAYKIKRRWGALPACFLCVCGRGGGGIPLRIC
jgi:cation-transporting ATPase 13A2